MPIHDWTQVDSGTFHHFHQQWTLTLCNALNSGVLPAECFAMVEQRMAGPIADILTLELAQPPDGRQAESDTGGLAVATAPPRAQVKWHADVEIYAAKANQVTIRHRHGQAIAVVEIVSPGNKHSSAEFRTFVEKSAGIVRQGIHLMVIDLFPPSPRDPGGMARAIWDQFDAQPAELPPGKPLTISSVDAGLRDMYVNFVGIGDQLPAAPLFIRAERYVPAPLEESYQEAWRLFPGPLKKLLEGK